MTNTYISLLSDTEPVYYAIYVFVVPLKRCSVPGQNVGKSLDEHYLTIKETCFWDTNAMFLTTTE